MRFRIVTLLLLATCIALGFKGCPQKPPPPPTPAPTVVLHGTPGAIDRGQTVTLDWSSTNATAWDIQPAPGKVTGAQGSVLVTPPESTLYTIAVTGPGGTARATAQVTVNVPPPPDTRIPTQLSLVVNANPAAEGVTVQFTAHLVFSAGGTKPTGGIQILEGTTALLTAPGLTPVDDENWFTSGFKAGRHTLHAEYSGDGTPTDATKYQPSKSPDLVFVVNAPASGGAPTIDTIQPASGSTAGGTVVSVTGQNLSCNTQLLFRGVPAQVTSVTVNGVTTPCQPIARPMRLSQKRGGR